MIIGDPYKFAVMFDRVNDWNASLSDNNGFFSFCIDGKMFPDIALNAILPVSVKEVKTSLVDIPVNEKIYDMDKSTAIKTLYQLVYPDLESKNDYRYLLSTTDFTDNDNFIFAVEGKGMIRILAAKLIYDFAESTHIFDDIEITEIILEKEEINKIVVQLEKAMQSMRKV